MEVHWSEEILQSVERALSKMPMGIYQMAFERLKEDVEWRLSISGRMEVRREDVLLIARQMVSGRMYSSLERELKNGEDTVEETTG